MKAWIGAGKVARQLARPGDIVLGHDKVEITDPDSLYEELVHLPASAVVVNAAAKINLEWCEANARETFRVNSEGAETLGRVCRELDLHLVHIGSGCVFDAGVEPRVFHEWSVPSPACVYAQSKLEADLRLLDLGLAELTIVRPRQLFSDIFCPTNLITKFASMRHGRFISIEQSATCIRDLGEMIDHLVSGHHFGVYNTANEGVLTPYEMASMIRDTVAPELEVEPVSYEDYLAGISVKRVNTVLALDKLRATGFSPRNVRDAFRECLGRYRRPA